MKNRLVVAIVVVLVLLLPVSVSSSQSDRVNVVPRAASCAELTDNNNAANLKLAFLAIQTFETLKPITDALSARDLETAVEAVNDTRELIFTYLIDGNPFCYELLEMLLATFQFTDSYVLWVIALEHFPEGTSQYVEMLMTPITNEAYTRYKEARLAFNASVEGITLAND